MRSFLLKITAFVVLMIAIDYTLGLGLNYAGSHVHKGDYGRNNYIAGGTTQEVLIAGSSRAIHHYDPVILADSLGMTCYNCGDDGMGIVLHYARLASVMERYAPRMIIYDVMPGFDLEQGDNTKYLARLRLLTGNATARQVCSDVDATEGIKQCSQLYRYNSTFADVVSQCISRDPSTAAEYTYAPVEGTLKYLAPPNSNSDILFDSLKIKYFEQLIALCEKHHTRLIFAVSPWYDGGNDKEYAPIRDLCKKHHIPLLMHGRDSAYVRNSKLFKDEAHMNREGAERYTRLIAHEIKGMEK